MRVCEHCGAPFEPTNTEQAYCRPQCAKKASLRRRKDRQQLAEILDGRMCPHPYKMTYRTWEEAAANTWAIDQGMRPYRCACGAIHYGHPSNLRKRRERRQLAGANQ